jgi:predicted Zn finger-like uncharacterized protein
MAITLGCPSCGRALRVPEELLGKAVRCPECRTTFTGPPAPADTAPAPEAAAPPASEVGVIPDLSLGEPAPPAPEPANVTTSAPPPGPTAPDAGAETRPCPYCAAPVGRHDERCRHCGEDLAEEEDRPWDRPYRRPVRRDCDPHRGALVLVLGIIGLVVLMCGLLGFIGLPFAISAWVMGNKDLAQMRAGTMDPEGQGLTQAGRICGIVGTVIDSLLGLGCVAYLVFMFAAVGVK